MEQLTNISKTARENNEKKQDKWKLYGDKKRRDHNFSIGDLVLVKTQILSDSRKKVTNKFVPKRDGPYRIREFKSSVSCDIETIQNEFVGTYHVSHLMPFGGDSNIQVTNPIRKRGRPKSKVLSGPNKEYPGPIEDTSEDEDFHGFTDSDITGIRTFHD